MKIKSHWGAIRAGTHKEKNTAFLDLSDERIDSRIFTKGLRALARKKVSEVCRPSEK